MQHEIRKRMTKSLVQICMLLIALAWPIRGGGEFKSCASGQVSQSEIIVKDAYTKALGRLPTTEEKASIYTAVRNKELTQDQIEKALLNDTPPSRYISRLPWANAHPDKVYAWSVDLHPSPVACNQVIYQSVGAIVHGEVDHHPYCEYYGVCADEERLHVFGLGTRASGFSLDPDHNVLKRQFYAHYKDNDEFRRIDTFICSHPAANCEIFEQFLLNHNKTAIIYFTTRFEFGRSDLNIAWRRRVIQWAYAYPEIPLREREWTEFLLKYHKQGKLILVANNKFDQKYVEYFTGLTPTYIPSWCGDFDGSYGEGNWVACDGNRVQYKPTRSELLVVPYKQQLWAKRKNHQDHKLYLELKGAVTAYLARMSNGQCAPNRLNGLSTEHCSAITRHLSILHSAELTEHSPEVHARYPAVLFLSYQTSVMTFFELYRLGIPIFAPSLKFLVELDFTHELVEARIYGTPKRLVDVIEKYSNKPVDLKHPPNPNVWNNQPEYNQSAPYWLQFSDIYHFPHIMLFDNWTHLTHLWETVNLLSVHQNMVRFNSQQRVDIQKMWDDVFRKAAPHRRKNGVVFDV